MFKEVLIELILDLFVIINRYLWVASLEDDLTMCHFLGSSPRLGFSCSCNVEQSVDHIIISK